MGTDMPPDWFADTDPRALKVFLECQRRMLPEQKLAAIFERNEMLDALARAEVRRQYPEAGEREVFLRALARRLEPELMRRVYGWPEDER